MDQAKEIRKGEELKLDKIEQFLRDNIEGLEGEMSVQQFHGGHANLTYLFKFGDRELVLRRPPFGKIAPGAHDMKREFRVLSKLYKHYPAAPRAFVYSEDEEIIGARFVVMERRTGVVLRYKLPECFMGMQDVEDRCTLALIKSQADLHQVDVEAADLTKLGRPEGFAERQLTGWAQRWKLSQTAENTDMDQLLGLLQKDIPKPQAVSIIHNDFKFDNCQFQPDNPDVITSVFDWDMCTTGDPLVDFGSTLGYWPNEYFSDEMPILLKGDFPKREYLIDRYAELTGFHMDRIDWYEAFAFYKTAIILQQLYQRYLKGDTSDPRMAKFEMAAKEYASAAIRILGKA